MKYLLLPIKALRRLFKKKGSNPERWEFIKRHLKAGDTFIDVGSLDGFYAIQAAKLGHVSYAFEADPEHFEMFKNDRRIRCFNVALSDKSGEAILYADPNNDHDRRTYPMAGYNKTTVRTAKLDDFDFPAAPIFLHMNVNGGEANVLRGAKNTMKRITRIVSQWVPDRLQGGKFDFSGFNVWGLDPSSGEISSYGPKHSFIYCERI